MSDENGPRDPHNGKYDAEIHRRKMMSQDERNISARDEMAKRLKESAEQSGNYNTSFEQHQKKANEIATKVDRDNNR